MPSSDRSPDWEIPGPSMEMSDDSDDDTSVVNLDSSCSKAKSKNQPFQCSFSSCGKVFGKRSRLKVHEYTHTGQRPFVCDIDGCSSSYKRKAHLERHQKSVHTSKHSQKEFRCSTCSKVYANCDSLKKHLKSHSIEKIVCEVCGQEFRKQTALKIHIYMHTGIKPYKCEFADCDRRFETPIKLKKHLATHNPNRYKCTHEHCTEAFSQFSQYRKHMALDHKKECKTCGKTFKEPRLLKAHLLTHEEIRDAFFCPYTPCERYYFDEKALRCHITTSHCPDFKGFTCDICNRSLVTKQKLTEHKKKIHDPNYKRVPKTRGPRKPRKDKGIKKRTIYHDLPGYMDSLIADTNCKITIEEGELSDVSDSLDFNVEDLEIIKEKS